VIDYNGKFVLLVEQKLVLYSSALEPVKELDLRPSPTHPKLKNLRIGRSPSGKTIWSVHEQAGSAVYQLFDSEALSPLGSWSEASHPPWEAPLAFADDKLAVEMGSWSVPSVPAGSIVIEDNYGEGWEHRGGGVAVRRLGAAWTVVCKDSSCGPPFFVNNDILALCGDPDIRLIRADGQPLSPEFRIGKSGPARRDATIVDALRASAGGNRFAVPLFSPRAEGGMYTVFAFFCNLARILVFDLPSGQWIGALEASQYDIERITDLALSPDGTLLALFRQEGIVEVYPLPASPATPQAK